MIALSYSRLSTYESCPLQFKLKFLDKTLVDDAENPHFVRGSNIHKQCENLILHRNAPEMVAPPRLSPEVMGVVPVIDSIFAQYANVFPERKLAINTKFQLCDWFDKSVMYRAIIDLLAVNETDALNADFKTGKVREYEASPTGQLRLASMFTMLAYPGLERVAAHYFFLDHKQASSTSFFGEELEDMKKTFREAFDKVNSDEKFEPKANRYCYFCKATKAQCPKK